MPRQKRKQAGDYIVGRKGVTPTRPVQRLPYRVEKDQYKGSPPLTDKQKKEQEERSRGAREREMKRRGAQIYKERQQKGETLKSESRKPGERPGEGKLQKVPSKKRIGGLGQLTPGQMSRRRTPPELKPGAKGPSVSPGKAGYWERVKRYATRNQRREVKPSTMEQRMESIGRTSEKAFGGFGRGTRRGGQIDIERERRKTEGPKGFTQRPAREVAAEAAARDRSKLSLEEKQRRGMRVTAADVPGTGLGRQPIQSKYGAAKVKQLRAGVEGKDLGAFKVTQPRPKRVVKKKKKGYQPPARAETFGEIFGGIFGKKKK